MRREVKVIGRGLGFREEILKFYDSTFIERLVLKNYYERGMSMAVSLNLQRCPQNHPCPALRICPVQALTQEGYNAPNVDEVKCIDCKKCVRFCPMGAFS